MLFDTHAHFDAKQFDSDRDEILKSLPENGVEYVVNIGADLKSSETSVLLAEKYPHVYASVGIHPEFADTLTDDALSTLKELAENKKVVAIGETGLDYYWKENPPKEIQIDAFIKQINLANEIGLPVIIHNRESTEDMVKTLKSNPPHNAIIHCVSVSAEIAKILIDMGYYISFAGTLTFKNAPRLTEVAKIVPLDKILIETDSPYLSPEPLRGTRNDSRNVRLVAEKLGNILNLSFEEICNITTKNAKKIYNIE